MFQANYNGFYDASEIEENAHQARRAYQISLAGFEDFTYHAEQAITRFNSFADRMMRELPEVESDLKNQMSVVKEQTRLNLDQVLKNQASAMASMSGGPVGMMMRGINNQASKMYTQQMNQGRIARLQEIQQQNKLYHDVVSDRMDIVRQSHQDLSSLINSVGANNTRLAQAGLQSSVDATRLMVNLRLGASEDAIKRSKLRYDWWTSMLNAEETVYQAQMNYMSNVFNTLTTSETAKYDTDVRALTNIYNSQAETNRNMFQSAMAGMVGVYQTNVNSRDRRDVAASNFDLGMRRMAEWRKGNYFNQQSRAIAAASGHGLSMMSHVMGSVDQSYAQIYGPNSLESTDGFMTDFVQGYGLFAGGGR